MDRTTLRSAIQYVNQMAANSIAFAQQLVNVGFDREDLAVIIAQEIAEANQRLESELAGYLVDAEFESTGPVVEEPETPPVTIVH